MEQDEWIIVIRRPVKREGSVQYLVIVLVSFALSVSLTRLFLSLSNYPQIGNGELHIAHVLWGGLFLFIAALLPLLMSNRTAYRVAAVLTGVGIGLFIDEVGKFITQKNDYFYPAAAPIIYIFFMLTLLVLLQIRRPDKSTIRAEMFWALETLQEWIYNPLSQKEQQVLFDRLEKVSNDSRSSILSNLASGILNTIQQDERPAPVVHPQRWSIYIKVLDRRVSERGLRITLAIGFLVIALIALKNPVEALWGSSIPPFLSWLIRFHAGRFFSSEPVMTLYRVRIILEIILGFVLLLVSLFLFFKQRKFGIPLGFFALLDYLGTIDMFLFYFEQFSTIIFVLYQVILLLGLIYYRTHFHPASPSADDGAKVLT